MYATTPQKPPPIRLVLVLLAGGAVAVTLGVYGQLHTPAAQRSTTLMFWSLSFDTAQAMLQFKSIFTTIAIVFALMQLVSGLRLREHISWPRSMPLWYSDFHRLCGTLALVFSLPVAYHCLWSLGFQTSTNNTRAVVHSFLGCFFYGAFVTKVLAVRTSRVPNWLVPVVGGLVLASLAGIWVSSALYFFAGKIG